VEFRMLIERGALTAALVVAMLATAGCSENTGRGAAVGAAAGAGVGLLGSGSVLGNAAKGAAVGAAGGFIYDQLKNKNNND
jgi:hypothetical protein